MLWSDASEVGVEAVLLQENDGKLYLVVAYASKKLNLTEACKAPKKYYCMVRPTDYESASKPTGKFTL